MKPLAKRQREVLYLVAYHSAHGIAFEARPSYAVYWGGRPVLNFYLAGVQVSGILKLLRKRRLIAFQKQGASLVPALFPFITPAGAAELWQ